VHILISVFFNSPHGGLHENIWSTTKSLVETNNKVTVICKPGEFANKLKLEGVGVIETCFATVDFNSIISTIEQLNNIHPISLIHSHPFSSRKVSVIASKLLGIPLITTVHGAYVDEIPETSDSYQKIVVVSKGIGTFLESNGLKESEKIFVSPNSPPKHLIMEKGAQIVNNSDRLIISLVSRLDIDKSFILDVFIDAVKYVETATKQSIHWLIVGDGSGKKDLTNKMGEICKRSTFEFTGWLEGERLHSTYRKSDVVIAPGRCALEAMACARATIALGSKGYVGLISAENWQQGVYSNFGGLGQKSETYREGLIERDLDALLSSPQARKDSGRLGFKVIELFYNECNINNELINLFKLVSDVGLIKPPVKARKCDFLELYVTGSNVVAANNKIKLSCDCKDGETLEYAWYILLNGSVIEKISYSERSDVEISLSEPGDYKFRCYIRNNEGKKISFLLGSCCFYNHNTNKISTMSSDVIYTPDLSSNQEDLNYIDETSISNRLNFNIGP
jgi:glycosyltransferase involved in cell wall biosynthesis